MKSASLWFALALLGVSVGLVAWTAEVTSADVETCVGDCDDGQSVTVDELLMMVNIALGNISVSGCDAGDANGERRRASRADVE